MWRACPEALPPKRGLNRRCSNIPTICEVCREMEEDGLHAVRDYVLVKHIWRGSDMDVDLITPWPSFQYWVSECLDRLDKEQWCRFAITCWAAWGVRNRFTFEHAASSPADTIKYVVSLCSELHADVCPGSWGRGAVQGGLGSSSIGAKGTSRSSITAGGGERRWLPPAEGRVKLNMDVGVLQGLGSGIGAVVRDGGGRLLFVGRRLWWRDGMWLYRRRKLCYEGSVWRGMLAIMMSKWKTTASL